jgi:glucose uptake protein GlcU
MNKGEIITITVVSGVILSILISMGIYVSNIANENDRLKHELRNLSRSCERLSIDRLEVKRILRNDTSNLAKYY